MKKSNKSKQKQDMLVHSHHIGDPTLRAYRILVLASFKLTEENPELRGDNFSIHADVVSPASDRHVAEEIASPMAPDKQIL